MRGALEGAATAPRAAVRVRAEPLLIAASAAVVAAPLLRGGGSQTGPLFWIGAGAAIAAAAGATAALAGALPRPSLRRAEIALVVLLAAYALWAGATIAWSVEPARSWDSFNRVAVYLALLVLGLLVGAAVREAPRAAAAVLAVALGAVIVWALSGAIVPALGPDVERSARLREPIGYWNALALAIVMSLPLWLWIGRALGAAALFAATVALLLTTSRGGLLAAVVAVAAWLVLVRPRRESLWTLLVAVPPAAAVAAWALTTAVAESGADGRGRAGALLGLALLAVGAGVIALARRPPPRATARIAAGLGTAAAVAVLAVAAVKAEDWWGEFRNPPPVQVTNDPARLREASSNHRWTWWTQGWTLFRAHPLGGVGAGSYELARRPLRQDTRGPLDPHNLGVKALAETGLVGFALLLGAAVAAVWTVAAALRRLGGEERTAAAALAAGGAAWLLHALVDMPWEYVAVSAPLFFGLGVLASSGRSRRERPRVGAALVLPAAVAAAVIASLALPWLAERRTEAALDAFARGDLAAAAAAARDARELNPLSIRPLQLEAAALETLGRLDEAERLYEEAVRLQPHNPQTWYELGRFEYETRRDPGEALVYLDRSWGLDRQSPETGPLLDAVRDELAGGG